MKGEGSVGRSWVGGFDLLWGLGSWTHLPTAEGVFWLVGGIGASPMTRRRGEWRSFGEGIGERGEVRAFGHRAKARCYEGGGK